MPTHQSLAGSSDEELLRRMVETHADRYGDTFWAFFNASVAPSLPSQPVMIDLGCGPGLFLRDPRPALSVGVPARLRHHAGDDRYGRQLAGVKLTLEQYDVTAKPLPHADGSVDLVSMSSVLHVFDEPLPVLARSGAC